METHAKKKTPQTYSTMQGESLIQEYSKPLEDLQESTPQVEDPQDDMEKDKSSELNDFVSAIKALGKNAAKSGKVREPEPFNSWDPKKLKTFILQCLLPRLLRLVPRRGPSYHLHDILSLGCCSRVVQTRALGTDQGTSYLAKTGMLSSKNFRPTSAPTTNPVTLKANWSTSG